MSECTVTEVLEALKAVQDPDLHRDIVSLGFVKNIKICGTAVSFDVELTTPACPVKENLKEQSQQAVLNIPGVREVTVNMTSIVREGGVTKKGDRLSGVKNIVAIASGKGGVGKSTTSANLAMVLRQTGARVGLMDADVYGPSIPTMFGLTDAKPETNAEGRLLPPIAYGIKIMSMGFLARADTPVVWRGPMASKIIQEFLNNVEWGELDYLLLDLPPGTGDVQLTICQSAPLTGALIVSTPQDVALTIARKGLKMFQQVKVPVLGLIENMSTFVCPHCHEKTDIFNHGGVVKACQELGMPFLGELPIDPAIVQAGDQGVPLAGKDKYSPTTQAYQEVAGKLAAQISITNIETAKVTVTPVEIKGNEQGELLIEWSDGHEGIFNTQRLRAFCPCAGCVDEMTGQRRIGMNDIASHVAITEVSPVGRYALHFQFSDGHATGIYSFDLLRQLCQCDPCKILTVATK